MDVFSDTLTKSVEVRPKKLIVAHVVKNFPDFYGTHRLITVFRRIATGSCLEPDESNPYHPIIFT
jgi:hypothetical protein